MLCFDGYTYTYEYDPGKRYSPFERFHKDAIIRDMNDAERKGRRIREAKKRKEIEREARLLQKEFEQHERHWKKIKADDELMYAKMSAKWKADSELMWQELREAMREPVFRKPSKNLLTDCVVPKHSTDDIVPVVADTMISPIIVDGIVTSVGEVTNDFVDTLVHEEVGIDEVIVGSLADEVPLYEVVNPFTQQEEEFVEVQADVIDTCEEIVAL